MALTDKAGQQDVWQNQNAHLAFTLPVVATVATNKQIHLVTELDSTRMNVAALQQQLAEKSTAARILKKQVERLTVKTAIDTKRIDELENAIGAAHEELAHRDNENRSLQKSVDLAMAENSRLSNRVAENDAAVAEAHVQLEQMKAASIAAETERDRAAAAENSRLASRLARSEAAVAQARVQLEQMKAALSAAEVERDKIAMAENSRLSSRLAQSEAAVAQTGVQLEQMKAALLATKLQRDEAAIAAGHANDKRRQETSSLNARLETMASSAAAADRLLAGVRRNLLDKLGLLQNMLDAKHRQADELKQSRSKLIERIGGLLDAFKARDIALAQAEAKNKLLKIHLAQAEAQLTKSGDRLEELRSELQVERQKRSVAEAACEQARANCAELRRERDNSFTTGSQISAPHRSSSADILFAETVTF